MTAPRPHVYRPDTAQFQGDCTFCGGRADAPWHIAPVVDIRSHDLGASRARSLRDLRSDDVAHRHFGLPRRSPISARAAEIHAIEQGVACVDFGDEQQRSEWINPGWTARAVWLDPPVVALQVRNGSQPNWLVRFLARWLVGIEWKRNEP